MPLLLNLLLLVAFFLAVVFLLQQNYFREINQQLVDITSRGLDQEIAGKTTMLEQLAMDLSMEAGLGKLIVQRDANALRASYQDKYQRFKSSFKISHFYLHDSEGINLIRLHKPERAGDQIDRFSLQEARRRNSAASGLELGPLGTFTLRTVYPIKLEQQTVGFVELGIEMEDILTGLLNRYDTELILLVRKNLLNRDSWMEGMKMLGRDGTWDLHPDYVVIFSTVDAVGHFANETENLDIENDPLLHETADSSYSYVNSPLEDSLGRRVGVLRVMQDVSGIRTAFGNSLFFLIAMVFLLTLASVFVISRLINRTDNRINDQQQALEGVNRLLSNVINASTDLIFVKDKDHRIVLCNDAFAAVKNKAPADMYGKTDLENGWDEEEVIGASAEGKQGFHDADNAVLAGVPKISSLDPVTIDGQLRYFESIKVPLRDVENEAIGVLGIARDITERREAEVLLRRQQKMEAIGQLTGGISHDFNNILAVIQGHLELLNLEVSDKRLKDKLKIISGAVDRGANLTLQLLNFSRVEALSLSAANLNELLQDFRGLIEGALTPGVSLDFELGEDLFLTRVDQGDFQDAVLNLIVNARDALQGSGNIVLKTQNVRVPVDPSSPELEVDDYVELIVSDTGHGIDPEIVDKIFEPFFTTKEIGKGTGLGLASVYAFVMRTGGAIDVTSEPGAGTTIRMLFPRDHEDDFVVPESDSGREMMRGKERVLVVDDEPAVINVIEQALFSLGYEVITALSGDRALSIMDEIETPDLLITDVVMPGNTNGYQLAEKFREKFPELKIIVCSGYADESMISPSQREFSTNKLAKPFSLIDLSTLVRHVLDE